MKRMALFVFVLLVPCVAGCFFTGLGVVMGTAVRLPFEITDQVLTGFEQGLNGTGTLGNRRTSPTYHEDTSNYTGSETHEYRRDANGNITW